MKNAAGLVQVSTPAGTHTFDRLVVCAGLQSDVVAKLVGASPSPAILPFRGEYWVMAAERSHLVRGMIYPVPDPRFPFLGVHFTRGVYDDVHVGPNAVPALAREGYSWGRVSLQDTLASLRWPGRRPWRGNTGGWAPGNFGVAAQTAVLPAGPAVPARAETVRPGGEGRRGRPGPGLGRRRVPARRFRRGPARRRHPAAQCAFPGRDLRPGDRRPCPGALPADRPASAA